MRAMLKWLLDLLYPPKCMLCHRLMEDTDAPTCGRCMDECEEYEKRIRDAGGIDLQILGVGQNGHIGRKFNLCNKGKGGNGFSKSR